MKKKLLTLLITCLVSTVSLRAANIAWVSFHSADNTPSSGAATATFTNAPDVGYTKLLAANGHTVTRFVTVDNLDTALLADGVTTVISALNTNDLIILSRSAPSGHYQALTEVAAWNTSITKPVMVLGGFLIRGGTGSGARLGYTAGETTADVNVWPTRLKVNAPGHPIFKGITLDSQNLMVNGYVQRAIFTNTVMGGITNQTGVSINNNTIASGGTVWAVNGSGGNGANGMVIGELPAGTTTSHAEPNDVLAAKRLIFLTGSRESGITSEGSGIFDLLPDGQTMFLNTVTYLTTPQPRYPQCYTPLVGATNLMAGDMWTFNAGTDGEKPLTFQWYRNGQPIIDGTAATLVFTNLTLADAGEYQLFITNAFGWSNSTLARLEFKTFQAASITNSLISYWPMDAVVGSKTVDLVSSYDMSLVNMTGTNLVAGKYGNAFQFNGANTLLARTHNAGDALPIYQYPEFTVSLWVNGPLPTTDIRDRRVFSEGSTTNGSPLFNIGTDNRNPPVDGSVDIYIRRDDGSVDLDHIHSTGIAYDGTAWHNIVYVQRDTGGGRMKSQLWIDGVLDPLQMAPVRPLTAQITSIGGVRRSGDSAWFNGMIDEVAVWNRALSAEEIAILQVTAITNPPSRVQPLAINSFKADLPAVVTGGSTTLRWDVSKDATQVSISSFGDITAKTSVGVGATNIVPSQTTNYVLTVKRGTDTLSATTSVAVVTGVTSGWTLLDNFDQAQLGNLFASGYWNDTSGNAGQVVAVNGNKALRTTSSGISFLNLRNLTVTEGQARTLFFRIIPSVTNAPGLTNIVGLTDKTQRSYGDEYLNIGPVLYAAAFTNDLVMADTNAWYIGARNGFFGGNTSPPVDYLLPTLDAGTVYNVWIDLTNQPMAEWISDSFSVWIQKEGDATRTLVFENYLSDRDFYYVDSVLGGMLPSLDKLVVMGNSGTYSAVFDDFYLSTGPSNVTVPKAYTIALQPGPISVVWSGAQLRLEWTNGTLQQADTVTGAWGDVPGNPTSPYLVTPSGAKFYRVRQ